MRAVLPSVQYADFLAVTLPAWLACLPARSLAVVTAPEDTATARVAADYGVPCLITDAWRRPVPVANPRPGGPVFNKGLALDEAFGFVPGLRDAPAPGECCLSLDADVYPAGVFPAEAAIAADTLYGCPRYEARTPEALRAALAGRVGPLIPPRGTPRAWTPEETGVRCLGFFQLFRYRPGLRFGSYWNAGQYDKAFRNRFASRRAVQGFSVLHLGEMQQANWSGRVVPAWA